MKVYSNICRPSWQDISRWFRNNIPFIITLLLVSLAILTFLSRYYRHPADNTLKRVVKIGRQLPKSLNDEDPYEIKSKVTGTLIVEEEEERQRYYDATFAGLRRRLPNVIMVGPESCGGKQLTFYLQNHPNVVANIHDVNFFAIDTLYDQGYDWYRNQMPSSTDQQLTATRGNLFWHTLGVPDRIKAMDRDVKLIINVCDPTRRLIRWYTQEVDIAKKEKRTPPKFEDLVFSNRLGDRLNNELRFIRSGKYVENLKRWKRVFEENIFIANAEILKSSPVSVLKQVESFLGLEHKLTERNIIYNSTHGACRVNEEQITDCILPPKDVRGPKPTLDFEPGTIDKIKKWFETNNKEFYDMTGHKF